jgi:hypothetical protein
MRSFNILVFDDFISGAGTVVYTRPDFYDKLGGVDKLALCAVSDQVTTTGTLTVQIEHSADGVNWIAKSGTAEIAAADLTAGSTEVAYGYDPGTSPTLGLVRLSLTIATSTMAHVKLWVTGRDAS